MTGEYQYVASVEGQSPEFHPFLAHQCYRGKVSLAAGRWYPQQVTFAWPGHSPQMLVTETGPVTERLPCMRPTMTKGGRLIIRRGNVSVVT
jgi:hypothetical protein